jgi:hypothetical protein
MARHLGVAVQIVAQGNEIENIGVCKAHMPFVAW